jgi:hypothetical protein
MKSLLERAKPQLLTALAKEAELYPHTTADLLKDLQENEYITRLPYGSAISCISLWGSETGEIVMNAFGLFSE